MCFVPHVMASLVLWLMPTCDSWAKLCTLLQLLGVLAFQKFLLSVLYSALPEKSQPRVAEWAAVVIPVALAILYVNQHLVLFWKVPKIYSIIDPQVPGNPFLDPTTAAAMGYALRTPTP
jgi:hypothetical protein